MATQHAAVKRLAPPLGAFIVDGFNFCEPDVRHYFLTHAHSDHTCGLHATFDLGIIYCSALTARVLRATLGIPQKLLHTIEPGDTVDIDGVDVTALDAGHCPGSLMFLFVHKESGHRALHTGDCRASPSIVAATVKAASSIAADARPDGPSSSTFPSSRGLVDTIYLDTTYAQTRWKFPAQLVALRMLGDIVRVEIAREPATLFIVGSYQVGKERAIAAVVRAAGGRALVPAHRALSLRLCNEWDESLHTETNDANVRVHVSPMGGMGAGAHEGMLETLQRSEGRYKAVVMLRPTGWSYTRALAVNSATGPAAVDSDDATPDIGDGRDGGDGGDSRSCLACGLPRVWAENDGTTRVYGVPYSEHSSYTELHALVSALRPACVVPTVNAERAAERERLVSEFAKSMDVVSSKRTINWHFRPRTDSERQAEAIEAAAERKAAAERDEAAEVAQQQRLWRLASDQSAAESSLAAPGTLSQLQEIVGAETPPAYLAALLTDGGGDLTLACSIHFVANGGVIPPSYFAEGAATSLAATTPCQTIGTAGASADSSCTTPATITTTSTTAIHASSSTSTDEELALPPGTVAWVIGKEFKLYTSREALEGRLATLGAGVVKSGSRHAKREVTLIVVAEGVEAGSVVRGACPSASIVHESWVVRRSMALRAGRIEPAKRPPPSSKEGKSSQKRPKPGSSGSQGGGGSGGEKRAARFRSMSAAAAARMERAASERLYLIEWRDASTTSPSGLLSLRHEFAVLGSTGNVYRAAVARMPSCTCVDFRDRSQICKHLLFVYLKVLGVSRESHVPVQRALLRSELTAILAPTAGGEAVPPPLDSSDAPSTSNASTNGPAAVATLHAADRAAVIASPSVRRAFRRATGRPEDEEAGGDSHEAEIEDEVAPRSSEEARCAICFDAIDEEAAEEVLADTGTGCSVGPPTTHCGLGCGNLFHSRCMLRWFEVRGPHARRECPVCRTRWRAETEGERLAREAAAAADSAGGSGGGDGEGLTHAASGDDAGFLNLSSAQPGMQRVRDTTTYSPWLAHHQRRRDLERLNSAARGGGGSR